MLIIFIQHVIDGDLCEMFNALDPAKQKSISEELDRTTTDVNDCLIYYTLVLKRDPFLLQISKQLEDIRTRFAF